jgi:glyoxylate reductase
MTRVVVTGRIPVEALDALRADDLLAVDAWPHDTPISRDVLLAKVRGADAIITMLTERVDAELLDAAGPQLRIVANVAVGYNNIDVGAAAERGVIVTNTPGVLTDATADIALALILMVTRRLGEGERIIRSGEPWQWGMSYMLGTGITGRRLGIVGMGAIGRATAVRAKACGMSIAYTRRSGPDTEIDAALGSQWLDLPELLATCDVVSLHCPYSADTHHLIDEGALANMRASSFLVNTSRGPIVDENALVDALVRQQIAGAGLDVYEHEPIVHAGLRSLENVVLLPHLGSATTETRVAMARLAAENCRSVLRGADPVSPVFSIGR